MNSYRHATGYFEADINYLPRITDEIAKRASDPVSSITIVISMNNQVALDCYRLSEMEKKRETKRVWEEINNSVKWEAITIRNDIPAKRMVHPFQNTKVLMEYEVEGNESEMEPAKELVVDEKSPNRARRSLRLKLMDQKQRHRQKQFLRRIEEPLVEYAL
jgi:hypothetical protein